MREKKDIEIDLKEINEISFNLTPLPIAVEEIEFGRNLTLQIGVNFHGDLENETFQFRTLINWVLINHEKPIVSLETELVFEIQNLAEVFKIEEDGNYQIDNNFLATLAGVALGTSRGILAVNVKGSPMSKFPLPILNPTEILDNIRQQQA
ncbi:MAG: hypothetical protein NWF06_02510 [Candidatus Bathyarchaeota archaeon]|nr:hypothetical protein [Candidatus Bathyarchaeum sp.]